MDERQEKLEWFLATLVMEISVDLDPRNVVHWDVYLLSASSADEAFEKAMGLGRTAEIKYNNPEGRQVIIRFRGIAQLEPLVDGEPTDGAELTFEEKIQVPEEEIRTAIRTKEELETFRKPSFRKRDIPDYSSGEVVKQVTENLSREPYDRRERQLSGILDQPSKSVH
jgi:hypothetical protein